MSSDVRELKKAAALRAVGYVRDGMRVGLGTGSTAEYAVRELGARVAQGLQIIGVPTSEKTAVLARQLGIPLATLEECPELDLTIDGADEVDPRTLDVIKGLGGALLREKIVALASKLEVLVVDESKIVERLGERTPVPVEVVQFGWTQTHSALAALGCDPQRRITGRGEPYITDSGNYLLDCRFPGVDDPADLATRIKSITGVVEHGLFVGIAGRVVVAGESGVQVIEKGA
ncbi:MAG TPA: ribose-5-phosphate isomerase RpiA [Chloroflexia bacterium]|nr:ribose-5-phosphate isomerase RpiA [Chloroflexia bacterium]